ncbi:MAG: helix-turn-helix transcriptional regulator [Bryobacteraceae bacterium]|nr:helix-turn-helix transcriptional regulator [Bryobacteraceae bacterium]
MRHRLTLEQEPYLAVRSFACDYSSGSTIEPHLHEWHQLLYATSGAMSVHAGDRSWMIPPGKAVVIPQGCPHTIHIWGQVAMRSLAFPSCRDAAAVVAAGGCRVLSVTPLLRELILRVIDAQALDERVPSDQRLMGVLLDEIASAPEAPLSLPLPSDNRALAVARRVLADPAGGETLDRHARGCGAGRRTLERLFRGETGLTFGLWRQKARMLYAVRLLSEGRSVTDTALDSGYNSVSAFIAAFKQTFGCTPGKL